VSRLQLYRAIGIVSRNLLLLLASDHFSSSRSQNRNQHSLGILQDIVVADPKHLKSLLLPQESLSLGIFLPAIIMTSPIDLDDEADFMAEEIHDVGTNRLLTAEFQSGQTSAAQAVPQHSLRDSRVSSQSPCVVGVRRDRVSMRGSHRCISRMLDTCCDCERGNGLCYREGSCCLSLILGDCHSVDQAAPYTSPRPLKNPYCKRFVFIPILLRETGSRSLGRGLG
jgi:hypothetical protein